MTRKISYQGRGPRKRKLSRQARKRMGIAGAQNLVQWRSRAREQANELREEVNAYRDSLLRDVGPNPTATKAGLIEAAVSTYAGIVKVRSAVVNSRRSDVSTLTERVSWLGSNLARLLKQLNLDARPRPRTLADLASRSTPQTVANPAPDVQK
jgi:hypothetical protein